MHYKISLVTPLMQNAVCLVKVIVGKHWLSNGSLCFPLREIWHLANNMVKATIHLILDDMFKTGERPNRAVSMLTGIFTLRTVDNIKKIIDPYLSSIQHEKGYLCASWALIRCALNDILNCIRPCLENIDNFFLTTGFLLFQEQGMFPSISLKIIVGSGANK